VFIRYYIHVHWEDLLITVLVRRRHLDDLVSPITGTGISSAIIPKEIELDSLKIIGKS
jgi:hypothetical protein